MKATLIAKTTPVADIPANDANEFVAYVARVSNPNNQHNAKTAPRLINYLMRHKHWSPFEHYTLTLEVECPKDIAVQLLRHRSFTFQEFSQRYAEVGQVGFVKREARLQDTTNRQNSLEVDDIALEYWWDNAQQEMIDTAVAKYEKALEYWWDNAQQEIIDTAAAKYEKALEKGIAKEQARALLPFGATNSRLYVTGNIRSWIHYLIVRLDPTTQKEHRKLAGLIKAEVEKVFDLSAVFEEVPALKALKWVDESVELRLDDRERTKITAKSPVTAYTIIDDGKRFAVSYYNFAEDDRAKLKTGFTTIDDAKQWVDREHYPAKMAPWLN